MPKEGGRAEPSHLDGAAQVLRDCREGVRYPHHLDRGPAYLSAPRRMLVREDLPPRHVPLKHGRPNLIKQLPRDRIPGHGDRLELRQTPAAFVPAKLAQPAAVRPPLPGLPEHLVLPGPAA
eukprot:scaffold426663_cov32-Prasinocladus_malaysianus.AAC.1